MKISDFGIDEALVKIWDLDKIEGLDGLDFSWLKEDLAYVVFSPQISADVGWYPEFQPSGHFVLKIIVNDRWENPLVRIECVEINVLKNKLKIIFEWCSAHAFLNESNALRKKSLSLALSAIRPGE